MTFTPSRSLWLRTGCTLALLLGLAACGDVPAPSAGRYDATPYVSDGDNSTDDSFEVASISEDELSETRGGFLMAGGLKLDFGLTTSTFVNGIIATNLTLSSAKLNGNLPANLQQIVQVGTGNNFDSPSSASTTNTVLTLVQNTANNATISNQNQLNLTVSNFRSFALQSAALSSLLPLVRSLH